jgi:hypothetical protein
MSLASYSLYKAVQRLFQIYNRSSLSYKDLFPFTLPLSSLI